MKTSRIWWKRIGLWHSITTIVTLSAFFIAYYTSGDERSALAFATIPFVVGFFYRTLSLVSEQSLFLEVWLLMPAVVFCLLIPMSNGLSNAGVVFVVLFLLLLVLWAIKFVANYMLGHYGISKRATFFSYAAHFVLTFAPILLIIWH